MEPEVNETPVEPTHKCSLCAGTFATEQEYIEHECPETGYTPADPEHQGPEFVAIQAAALARGAERAAAEETEQTE